MTVEPELQERVCFFICGINEVATGSLLALILVQYCTWSSDSTLPACTVAADEPSFGLARDKERPGLAAVPLSTLGLAGCYIDLRRLFLVLFGPDGLPFLRLHVIPLFSVQGDHVAEAFD